MFVAALSAVLAVIKLEVVKNGIGSGSACSVKQVMLPHNTPVGFFIFFPGISNIHSGKGMRHANGQAAYGFVGE
jgi:hypothetical protein